MPESSQPLRQTCAELLAYAICELFPGTLLVNSFSSPVDFFYDFIIPQKIDEQALPIIEEKMRFIAKQDTPIRHLEMMRENAAVFLTHHKQELRAAQAAESLSNIISLFQIGKFVDLSEGPHLENINELTAFKLLSIEPTACQIPDLEDANVTRIRGTAFEDTYHLKRFLKRIEQYKKKDHRTLGPQQNLFTYVGDKQIGCWVWLSKGNALKASLLKQVVQANQDNIQIFTPTELSNESITESTFQVAHKNDIPQTDITSSLYAAISFKSNQFSPEQMPINFFEIQSSRNEQPEELHGLLDASNNIRDFTHTFCRQDQIGNELISYLQFIDKSIKIFGFEYRWNLCVQQLSRKGSKSNWKQGVDLLTSALEACKIDYNLDTQSPMRYGPRAEVLIADPLGREWSGPFVDVDVVHPECLGLRYQGDNNYNHNVVMVTRSLFGSLERFVALLVEHYSGDFPFWLTPEQVRIIPLAKNNAAYASQIQAKLKDAGYRSDVDFRLCSLGEKVHFAEKEKVPFIAIVGDNEEKKNIIALRSDNSSQKKTSVSLDQFLEQLRQDSNTVPAL